MKMLQRVLAEHPEVSAFLSGIVEVVELAGAQDPLNEVTVLLDDRGALRLRWRREGERRPVVVRPHDVDWQQFGCSKCGNVRMLPAAADEDPPWCIHHGGEYSWRDPAPSNARHADPMLRWTRMVRVAVVEIPTATTFEDGKEADQ